MGLSTVPISLPCSDNKRVYCAMRQSEMFYKNIFKLVLKGYVLIPYVVAGDLSSGSVAYEKPLS